MVVPTAFAGQHVVITGGSAGIGLACAHRLFRQGANLTLIARGADQLDAAVRGLEPDRIDARQRILTFSVDVSDAAALDTAIEQASQSAGPPDVLITCAGYCRPGRIDELSLEIFERTAAVNYLGTVHAALSCLPKMRKARKGHLMFVSSGAGLIGVTGYAAYSPTKFAVRGLAEVLRADLKHDDIHVSIVYPPDTRTAQLAYEEQFKPPETRAITGSAQVLEADDVARAMVQGLLSRRFAITPSFEMTLLERLSSLLRPVLFWHFDRLAARARQKALQ